MGGPLFSQGPPATRCVVTGALGWLHRSRVSRFCQFFGQIEVLVRREIGLRACEDALQADEEGRHCAPAPLRIHRGWIS